MNDVALFNAQTSCLLLILSLKFMILQTYWAISYRYFTMQNNLILAILKSSIIHDWLEFYTFSRLYLVLSAEPLEH